MHEKIEAVLKHPWSVPAAIGVIGFGSGLGLGYIFGKRKGEGVTIVHSVPSQLSLNFNASDEEETAEEIAESVRPAKVVITPEEAVKRNILKIHDLSELRPEMLSDDEPVQETETEISKEDNPDVVVTVSSEITEDEDWDWEEELSKRTETEPYILQMEEFYNDEKSYHQVSLTYYAIDDIMVDEDDAPVYNYLTVTGELKFGHGSGDPNVVYVRNDKNRAEYEITRLDALYSREVLGLEIEDNQRVKDLKHSRYTKFRME